MKKNFYKQSRLVEIIILLIPVVNWVVETVIRFEVASKAKKYKLLYWVLAFVSLFGGGLVFGWIDILFVLFTKHLFLAK